MVQKGVKSGYTLTANKPSITDDLQSDFQLRLTLLEKLEAQ